MSRQQYDIIAELELGLQLDYLDNKKLFSVWHLYQLGAQLINNGLAYQTTIFTWNQHDCRFEFPNDIDASSGQQKQLVEQYQGFTQYHENYGSRRFFKNTLHAIFVVKVALDHLDEATILALYAATIKKTEFAAIGDENLEFPNGSHFVDSSILNNVLALYIEHNQEHFNNRIKTDELNKNFLLGKHYKRYTDELMPVIKRKQMTVTKPQLNYGFILNTLAKHPVKTLATCLMVLSATSLLLGIGIITGVLPILSAGAAITLMTMGAGTGLFACGLFNSKFLKLNRLEEMNPAYYTLHR